MDDTNPSTEDMEYVEALKQDVQWLGFDWGEHLYFASDYFEQLYDFAVGLIKAGKAYVCSLSEDETRAMRGTVSEPGTPSPYRSRSVAENLELFEQMREGDFPEGAHVLRAMIDMANPNMKMRDPLLYRIRHEHHYRTENKWCIYPMYDFAHCLSDSLEGITHSICTLEFENNRELYDWIIDNCDTDAKPRQYEFARLNLNYSVMSKRKLLRLVKEGYVSGWDDPRMFTLSGLRRRGYTPASIREFADRIGVAKANSTVDVGILEYCIRDDLGDKAPRVMAVLDPLKVVIENYPEGQEEMLEAPYWPPDHPSSEWRQLPFSREIYIEREDFMEEPSKKFFRLAPGREVRLRHAYVIRCNEVVKDGDGQVIELRCTYDSETKSGEGSSGRRVKGTLHWVSVAHAYTAEVRLYDRLFSSENPDGEDGEFVDYLNPMSLETRHVPVEPGLPS
jgi:glutaminyl-tRNA synthetase